MAGGPRPPVVNSHHEHLPAGDFQRDDSPGTPGARGTQGLGRGSLVLPAPRTSPRCPACFRRLWRPKMTEHPPMQGG